MLRKLIYRPKTGTLRAKWLEKLKLKEELEVTTRFTKRDIGKYYQTVAGQFFLKKHPITIT
jgi:hypothetical protein